MGERTKRCAAVAVATGVMAAVLTLGAPGAGAVQSVKSTITAVDVGGGQFDFLDAPTQLTTGTYKVELQNDSFAPHVFVAVRVTNLEAYDAAPSIPAFLDAAQASGNTDDFGLEVGAVFAKPGSRGQKQIDATIPGTYIWFCPIGPPDGPASAVHYNRGLVGEITVG